MANNSERNSELLPGEQRVLQVNRHPLVLVGRSYLVVGLGLILIVVAALVPVTGTLLELRWFAILLVALVVFVFLDVQYIRWRAESYTITDQRIITRRGVISRFSRAIGLSRVQDVTTYQGLFGRVFGYGTVEVETAGRDGAEALTFVPRPMEFRNAIYESLQPPGSPAGSRDARQSPA
ncbi:MAG: PH domain-containing protein [Candidatus Dormiibacterota bacterium]